jgi:hypothetical protein
MSRADDYDDRPRRRPRDDDEYDDDDRPRRGNASGGGGGGAVAGMSVALIIGIVVAVLFCCAVPIGIGLLLPAVQKVREAAARTADMNKYKEVTFALHKHQDVQGRFPPADGAVSWRVHLLPKLKQDALYAEFDTTQPWDGAKNRRHADTRVEQYVSALDVAPLSQSRMRVFTGPDTLFPPGRPPLNPAQVTDGFSNTILLVEADEAVAWPQPRELPYTNDEPLPRLGYPLRASGFIVAMADGSVRFVNKTVAEHSIRGAITAKGGEAPPDF